ncbi:unnamed protein product, partial [Staurois parvus]
MSTVSGHSLYWVRSLWSSLYCVRSLWSFPVYPSLCHLCTVSADSGHLLYCVHSLWSSPVVCLQSLVISCTMSIVSGHLYCVPLVIPCTVSADFGHPLYCVCSPLVQYIFVLVFLLKPRRVLWSS